MSQVTQGIRKLLEELLKDESRSKRSIAVAGRSDPGRQAKQEAAVEVSDEYLR